MKGGLWWFLRKKQCACLLQLGVLLAFCSSYTHYFALELTFSSLSVFVINKLWLRPGRCVCAQSLETQGSYLLRSCHSSDKIIQLCFLWNPKCIKYWYNFLGSIINNVKKYVNFSISSTKPNRLKPIQIHIYIFGVKSILETEFCSNIYFNKIFWNVFVSLKIKWKK